MLGLVTQYQISLLSYYIKNTDKLYLYQLRRLNDAYSYRKRFSSKNINIIIMTEITVRCKTEHVIFKHS